MNTQSNLKIRRPGGSVAWRGFEWSRCTLGTVQFGLTYGVANQRGQPSPQAVVEMISKAFEMGINCLDTASTYGTSEQVIGKALKELHLLNEITVITKIRPISSNISAKDAGKEIRKSVEQSLQYLQLESLPLCLFHREQDFQYIEELLRIKELGLIQHIGVSTYTPARTREIIQSGLADAIQIPSGILDTRFTRPQPDSGQNLCQEACTRDMTVFVRSIYLQGLLFIPEQRMLEEFREVHPVRHKLSELAKKHGMELAELAVRYVLSIPELHNILIGVESMEQLNQNVRWFEQDALPKELFKEITEAVPHLPESILNPSLWKTKPS